MSVRFFNIFVNSVRLHLPRNINILKRAGVQTKFSTMAEIAAESKIVDIAENTENKAVNADQNETEEIVRDKSKTRYNRRKQKRQWEDPDPNKLQNGESEVKKLCDKPIERIKKKKMAMLLGYCGVNYYGMQRNPGVPTIEEELLKALLEAKYITEEDFANQQNAQFQRSSRTDKGVSAARQVVSLKLPLEVNIDEINKRLPPCIKVFSIKRATNKFNSKSKCNARTYSYTLPTYVFEPSITSEEDKKSYRISAEKYTKVNEVLSVYKGTKNYYNFTEKKYFQDPSALRYMMSFALERVFLESEMEFAELLVKGQSFMLHQIRKMVGLMIAIVRNHTDMSTLEKAFSKEKVMIPTAPGLGLVLDKVHYERYGARYKDSHDSLDWDDQDEAVQRFKHEQIFPSIIKGEIEDNSMGLWLEKIKHHSYEPSDDTPEVKNDEIVYDDDDDNVDTDKDGLIVEDKDMEDDTKDNSSINDRTGEDTVSEDKEQDENNDRNKKDVESKDKDQDISNDRNEIDVKSHTEQVESNDVTVN